MKFRVIQEGTGRSLRDATNNRWSRSDTTGEEPAIDIDTDRDTAQQLRYSFLPCGAVPGTCLPQPMPRPLSQG